MWLFFMFLQVTRISSLTKEGIPELWHMIQQYRELVSECGELVKKRQHQHQVWMWNYIRDHIMELFVKHGSVKSEIVDVEDKVARGVMTPGQGADILLHRFIKDSWCIPTVVVMVNVLKFRTLVGFKKCSQTVQTQIRLLLKKQSDQCLPCLLFWHECCEFQPLLPSF